MLSVPDGFALSEVVLERWPMSSTLYIAKPELVQVPTAVPCSHDATLRADEMFVGCRVAHKPQLVELGIIHQQQFVVLLQVQLLVRCEVRVFPLVKKGHSQAACLAAHGNIGLSKRVRCQLSVATATRISASEDESSECFVHWSPYFGENAQKLHERALSRCSVLTLSRKASSIATIASAPSGRKFTDV